MKSANRIIPFAAILALLTLVPVVSATNWHVNIQNLAFAPHGTHAVAGDTITWRNLDAITHSSVSDNGVWNSGPLNMNQQYSFVFTSTGTYPYHCSPHTFMRDTIFVGIQTGINDPGSAMPRQFEIVQNYPNPFNAQTTIKYYLPAAGNVTIEIFNTLGQKVAAFDNGLRQSGENEYVWNAAENASGVFFYRINALGQSRMGRMTLLK